MHRRRLRRYDVFTARARLCRRLMGRVQQYRSPFSQDSSLLKADGKLRRSINISRPPLPPIKEMADSTSAALQLMERSAARVQTAFHQPHTTKRLRAFSSNSSRGYTE